MRLLDEKIAEVAERPPAAIRHFPRRVRVWDGAEEAVLLCEQVPEEPSVFELRLSLVDPLLVSEDHAVDLCGSGGAEEKKFARGRCAGQAGGRLLRLHAYRHADSVREQ